MNPGMQQVLDVSKKLHSSMLESRNHRMKVETLVTNQIMKILLFSDSLLQLKIFGSIDQPLRTLEIDELPELDIYFLQLFDEYSRVILYKFKCNFETVQWKHD